MQNNELSLYGEKIISEQNNYSQSINKNPLTDLHYAGPQYKSMSYDISNNCESNDYAIISTFSEFNNIIENKKKELNHMSYAQVMKASDKIIFASDSRTIFYDKDIPVISDNFKKLIYLPLSKIGLAATGINIINGVFITDLLSQLDKRFFEMKDKYNIFKEIVDFISNNLRENQIVNLCAGYFENNFPKIIYSDITKNNTTINNTSYIWHINGVILYKLYTDQDGGLDIRIPDLQTAIDFSKNIVESEIMYSKCKVGVKNNIGGEVQLMIMGVGGIIK